MKLKFLSEYNSVKSFDDIDISNFSFFTGKNGSGKTHTLEAIKNGSVIVEGYSADEVLLLGYSDFVIDFQTRTNYQTKIDAWNRLSNINNSNDIIFQLKNHENIVRSCKEIIESVAKNLDRPVFELTESDLPKDQGHEIITGLSNYKKGLDVVLNQENYKNDDIAQSVYESVVMKSSKLLSSIEENEFLALFQKTAFGGRKIMSDLSNIFLEYKKNQDRNKLKIDGDSSNLSIENFEKKYGSPPWELIRKIFAGFNLNFDVNDPVKEKIDSFDGTFQIKFINTARDIEVPFVNLSSGEKILITMVNAVYSAIRKNNLPKLLLLDEIDGPLNPSIIEKFVEYIKSTFVDAGINVIIATHSPSTIAFAPSNSIYIIDNTQTPPIKIKSNEEAIDILSEGFVTLDRGIKLFDQISASKLSIISEGRNIALIKKALEFYEITNAEIISNIEDRSGSTQIKTLFDFFSKVPHDRKVIFVWDCDVNFSLAEENNTIPYIFSRNPSNKIATKGIENLFDEELFEGYKKTITMSDGSQTIEFDQTRKKDFENFIIDRNQKEDFKNFEQFIEKIKEI